MGSAEVSPGTPSLWCVGSRCAGTAEAEVSLGNRRKEKIPCKRKQRAKLTNGPSASLSHHRKLPTWGELGAAGESEATQPPSEPSALLTSGAAVGTSKSLLELCTKQECLKASGITVEGSGQEGKGAQ